MDIPNGWELKVGEELRKNFLRYRADGFFDRYLSGANILDIGYKGYLDDVKPIFPHAVGVDLDFPGYDGKSLPFPDQSQDAVFASHTLEHIADYRAAVAEWFRTIRIGGFLVIVVPDVYLYERKRTLPSRWNADHRRFYTVASLLDEVDEALDPFSYRIRHLEENDRNFDYNVPPDRHAVGCYEIVMVLERVARPEYADAVFTDRRGWPDPGSFSQLVPPSEAGVSPIVVVESTGTRARRVLVLKLDHRGDLIMAHPALRQLRDEFASSEITLVCGPWNVEDAKALGVSNRILPFAFFNENGGLNAASSLEDLLSEFENLLADEVYDLAIDLRVNEETRGLLKRVKAEQRAGFGYVDRFPFLDIALPFTNPTLMGRASRTLLRPDKFGTRVGHHEGYEIAFNGPCEKAMPTDNIIWGPYADLDAGTYVIEMIIEPLGEDFEFSYDVAANGGSDVLGAGRLPVRRGKPPSILLELSEATRAIEIRIQPGPAGLVKPFRFLGGRLRRSGRFLGPHQQEMMAMLVFLVGMRLRAPFRVREVT